MTEKTLHNSDISGAKKNISDLKVFGDGDLWQLISKASSKEEGWMKSTKAMEIDGAGCMVQVTTQQGEHVAEAVAFAPDVAIVGDGESRKLVARHLSEDPLTFKSDAVTVESSDYYYDLFEDGRIDPSVLLMERDATTVKEAMDIIQNFFVAAELAGFLKEG
jgi:hypothetical protein